MFQWIKNLFKTKKERYGTFWNPPWRINTKTGHKEMVVNGYGSTSTKIRRFSKELSQHNKESNIEEGAI